MNIDYSQPKIDLVSPPINETIKEQNFEDDEEEEKEPHQFGDADLREDPHLQRRHTFEPEASRGLDGDRLFLFHDEDAEMNLDSHPADLHMDISNGPTSKFYSLDPQEEDLGGRREDVKMEYDSDYHYSLTF